MPQKFEPGLYISRAPLTEESIDYAPTVNPEISRAIGMAALPEEYQGQQLTNLVYNGMTSARYAAQHNAWLADRIHTEHVMRSIEAEAAKAEDDKDSDSTSLTTKQKLALAKK